MYIYIGWLIDWLSLVCNRKVVVVVEEELDCISSNLLSGDSLTI